MAESMLDIKRHIKSISGTEHITKAMKLVSASKFKKAKDRLDEADAHLTGLIDEMKAIIRAAAVGTSESAFVKKKQSLLEKNDCYIVITSNKGLCGAFNSNVIRSLKDFIKEKEMKLKDGSEPHIISIGSKGEEKFRSEGLDIKNHYSQNIDELDLTAVRDMTDSVMNMIKSGEIDELYIVYTHFINSINLKPIVIKLLPFEIEPSEVLDKSDTEYEPSKSEIIDYMIPKYVELELYRAVIESEAAEHIARRNAMDTATENANEMMRVLSLRYNRARQAGITNELIEIVSGAEALGN